ncbi:MAG TPA: arginine--tRNA ligase [Chloroflexota bacterium]|nr:arginine--tRNA ligase [Chloroflexota bacterium]
MTTVRGQLRDLLADAVQRAQQQGVLPAVAVPEITVENPQNPEHGDYASNIALRMARTARMDPMSIALALANQMSSVGFLSSVDVARPGFLNFRLSPAWLASQVEEILAQGDRFGAISLGNGEKVQIEYVSANPTGPLPVGAGRGAALGDSLARILSLAGYKVEREYYVNDAGARMEAFYSTLYARYLQQFDVPAEVPADGYAGEYMVELAGEIAQERGREFLDMPREEALPKLGRLGTDKMVGRIRADLARMNVHFDNWFSEQSLYDDSQVTKSIGILQKKGYVAEREGAVWFVSSALGEEKDNVLVRTNGAPTYFASDVAYHYDKFVLRGFDKVIDIWGADHQGHVPRMKAMVSALGIDPDRLILLLYQLVSLKRGGKAVRMSKRTGEIITLDEVLEEVGPDAVRFFLLARSADAMMDFDLDLAKEESSENPVYYVQYAHARIASILRYASEVDFSDGDVSLLTSQPEQDLIRKMVILPELVEIAASNLEPHHLPHYAQEIAAVFHSFYKQCRVVTEDEALTKARLKLVSACKLVLGNTLSLMGVNAPEQM